MCIIRRHKLDVSCCDLMMTIDRERKEHIHEEHVLEMAI